MAKTIGIMSLKGGVGKTSIVAGLGSALAELGKKVLLIDANFSAPNLGIHFNLIEPEVAIQHVLGRKSNISDAIYNVGGLDIMPAEIFSKLNFSPMRLRERINPLKRKYDIILIDSSPTMSEESVATFLAADEIFFVTTPDHSTLSNTLKFIKEANERGTPIDGLILNQVHDKSFEIPLSDIESATNYPVLAVLPFDIDVKEAQSKFIPSTKHKPNSKGSKELKKLAATIVGQKVPGFDWRVFFKLAPKRQDVNREVFYQRVFG